MFFSGCCSLPDFSDAAIIPATRASGGTYSRGSENMQDIVAFKFLTESSKSPASIAQSNKQWVGTCLYQEWCKPLLISCKAAFGYEQVAKRIANIRLTHIILGQNIFWPQLMPTNCSAAKQLPQFCKHSKSADLLRKSLLSHVLQVPSSKALSCKHERLFDLLTLAS